MLFLILFIVFTVLKLVGVIAWTWATVCAPLYFLVIFEIFYFVFSFSAKNAKEWEEVNNRHNSK